jgi:hypothetical protein
MRTPETGARTERLRPAAPPAGARAPQTSPAPDPALAAPHPPPSSEQSREPGEPDTTLRLLDSPASRLALREMARQPLLSERAASATGIVAVTGAQRMADAASAAGRGDCGRGEFLGGGMGVLSLPFLAAAVATGQCRR